MSTTTIRLDAEDEATLNELAGVHGGRSNALRQGLKLLAAATRQRVALAEFLAEWELEAGPVSDEEKALMAAQFEL